MKSKLKTVKALAIGSALVLGSAVAAQTIEASKDPHIETNIRAFLKDKKQINSPICLTGSQPHTQPAGLVLLHHFQYSSFIQICMFCGENSVPPKKGKSL